MDFRGAGEPLIFFGPLRGAANSSHEGPNQTFALGGEFRGGPQACGSVWYATLSPWRPGTSGPWAAGKLWPLGGREALAPGHLPDLPGRWSSAGSPWPLVIWRICLAVGSSHGFAGPWEQILMGVLELP